MPKTRFCVLCNRQQRARRTLYTRIKTVERAEKLLEGYRRRHNGRELNQSMLNQEVHRTCYNKVVRGISSDYVPLQRRSSTDVCDENMNEDELALVIDNVELMEQDEISGCDDKSSLIQFRSRMPPPTNLSRRQFQRRQLACALCNRYAYKSYNKIKQITSNFMADKLAQGFHRLYQRQIGFSLLDAHMHEACIRKLYSSYRYHVSKKPTENFPLHLQNSVSSYSPHGTRSRITLDSSSLLPEPIRFARIAAKPSATTTDTTDVAIEQFLATPLYTSVATTNPSVELSARSDLFRPCLLQLNPEEIELYTKRQSMAALEVKECNSVGSSLTYPYHHNGNREAENNDEHIVEQDTSPDWTPTQLPPHRSAISRQQKISTAAIIRRRYLKPPPLARPTIPVVFDNFDKSNNATNLSTVVDGERRPLTNIEQLHLWLIEQLKSSGQPMSMADVQVQFKIIANGSDDPSTKDNSRESVHRDRIRARLEKHYPNQFFFVTPNKREGTFVALNDIDHYVRHAIKIGKEEKERAAAILAPPSVVVSAPPVPGPRDTCEKVMTAVRKLRLYVRDSTQTDSIPHVLIRNFIGLLTASERRFDKISQQYDFYRMIDDDLFTVPTTTDGNTKLSSKLDKTVRNMSLASDLISARHDHRISAKHFLLADELMKKSFHCTPRQVMTLLNRYGHTCSYKSYTRMKALQIQTADLGEVKVHNSDKLTITDDDNEHDIDDDNSSDSALESIQL